VLQWRGVAIDGVTPRRRRPRLVPPTVPWLPGPKVPGPTVARPKGTGPYGRWLRLLAYCRARDKYVSYYATACLAWRASRPATTTAVRAGRDVDEAGHERVGCAPHKVPPVASRNPRSIFRDPPNVPFHLPPTVFARRVTMPRTTLGGCVLLLYAHDPTFILILFFFILYYTL